MKASPYNSALHTAAMLTACATFPLIFMGGLVTSHKAGLSVPDWPNSYGYNMFLFPPRLWIGGIFYEHTHRLMGTVVGIFAIILTIVAWKTDRRRWVRWMATSVLGLVIFQGILGGLRVVLLELDLAIVHACTAQAFFCLATLMTVMSSRWWSEAKPAALPASAGNGPTDLLKNSTGRSLVRLAIASVLVIYLQLIVGATMRHYEAGLAIPDFPTSYGKVLPPTDDVSLAKANLYRAWTLGERKVTLAQIWVHFGHRIGAIVVSFFTIWLAAKILRRETDKKLRRPAVLLIVLLLVQLTLGILTVLLRKPADIASAHVAVGALVLTTTFVIAARSTRLYGFFAAKKPVEMSYGAKPAIA